MRKLGICLMLFTGLFFSPLSYAEEAMVYYTDLTCKPEEDRFEMVPKQMSKQALAEKTDAQSRLLQQQDYAVFLNGEKVGEKTFTFTCRLKNDVKVEVDVDYGREREIIPKETHIELYKSFKEHNNIGFQEYRMYSLQGEIIVTTKTKLVANISNPLIENSSTKQRTFAVVVDNRKLHLNYPKMQDMPELNYRKTLDTLKEHPIIIKGFFATSN